MATREALVRVLQQVALGDEAATEAFAQYLTQGEAVSQNSQIQEIKARADAYVQDKAKYLDGLDYFKRNNSDIFNSPVALAYVKAQDEKLARTRPDLSYEERFDLAVERTRKQYPDVDNADTPEIIAQIAGKNRSLVTHGVDVTDKGRVAARARVDKEEEEMEQYEDEQSQMEAYNSGIISKMKRDRFALREVHKPSEPPRAQRATPHPDLDYDGE